MASDPLGGTSTRASFVSGTAPLHNGPKTFALLAPTSIGPGKGGSYSYHGRGVHDNRTEHWEDSMHRELSRLWPGSQAVVAGFSVFRRCGSATLGQALFSPTMRASR